MFSVENKFGYLIISSCFIMKWKDTQRFLLSWWISFGPLEFKPFTLFWHPENEDYVTSLSSFAYSHYHSLAVWYPWFASVHLWPTWAGKVIKEGGKLVYGMIFPLKFEKMAFYNLALCSLKLMMFLLNNKRNMISLTFF